MHSYLHYLPAYANGPVSFQTQHQMFFLSWCPALYTLSFACYVMKTDEHPFFLREEETSAEYGFPAMCPRAVFLTPQSIGIILAISKPTSELIVAYKRRYLPSEGDSYSNKMVRIQIDLPVILQSFPYGCKIAIPTWNIMSSLTSKGRQKKFIPLEFTPSFFKQRGKLSQKYTFQQISPQYNGPGQGHMHILHLQ